MFRRNFVQSVNRVDLRANVTVQRFVQTVERRFTVRVECVWGSITSQGLKQMVNYINILQSRQKLREYK